MNGGNYVKDRYNAEEHAAHDIFEDSLSKPVSVRLRFQDMAILEGLTARFGDTRSSLVADAVNGFVKDAFEALSPEDRLKVAAIADEFISSSYEKEGSDAGDHQRVTGWAKVLNRFDVEEKAA